MDDKQTLNMRDIARAVSEETGFTIADIEAVMRAEDVIIARAISQGYSIKKHKLFRLDIETKPEKARAYNGFSKEYYTVPEKKIVKIQMLKQLRDAIDELNKSEDTD